MTVHFTLSAVPDLHRRIDKEVAHRLAIVVFTTGDGYGYGVVEGASGDCIAWDGVYFDDDAPQTNPLDQLDWDEWDDMNSKLVFSTQAPWLAGPLGFWLMPSYSVAKEAAELVSSWGDSHKGDAQHLRESNVVCYLPVTEQDAYDAHLADAEKAKEGI